MNIQNLNCLIDLHLHLDGSLPLHTVKELAEQGYDKYNIGITYPYVLAAPEGFSLDENAVYKVVICGASDEVKKEGNIEDSGIVGIEAAKEYFSQFEAFSAKDIAWKEISFDEASAGK